MTELERIGIARERATENCEHNNSKSKHDPKNARENENKPDLTGGFLHTHTHIQII